MDKKEKGPCADNDEPEAKEPKIDIRKIPQFQLDRLSSPLIHSVSEYFKNPKVQKDFEEWQRAQKANDSQQTDKKS